MTSQMKWEGKINAHVRLTEINTGREGRGNGMHNQEYSWPFLLAITKKKCFVQIGGKGGVD